MQGAGYRRVRRVVAGGWHEYVLVEIDLHPKTLGVSEIVESEFGATLREVAKEA